MPNKQVPRRTRQHKRPPKATPTKTKAVTAKEAADRRRVENSVARIQKCYDTGVAIRNACARYAGACAMKKQAKQHRLADNTALRFRQFATLYTPADLDALFCRFRSTNYALTMTPRPMKF